jgi:hypothetical protein
MEVKRVTDPAFLKYGRIIENADKSEVNALLEAMRESDIPEPDGVIYEPSIAKLEALPIRRWFSDIFYGEMPVQVGYCNGHNRLLNGLEYHRSSEINVGTKDMILILGLRADVREDFTYETSGCEAFMVPAGVMVEIFASTLHYAPCDIDGKGFRCVVVLPEHTNFPLKAVHDKEGEDKLLTAVNKWLIAHKDGGCGDAFIGLKGENLSV